MKKVKFVLWVLVLGFIVLVIFQNQTYLLAKHHLLVNIFLAQYQTPDLANGIYILLSFILGLLIAYFLGLSDRLRSRKTIKKLKETLSTNDSDLSALRDELEALKQTPSDPAETEMQIPK